MKAVVILAYIENYDQEFVMSQLHDADLTICADGGQTISKKYNITPDVFIGDFQSSNDRLFNCEYVTYPSEKDITDAEACALYCIDHNVDNLTFIGGIGGRLDHTLGALSMLLKFNNNFNNLCLIDKKNKAQVWASDSETVIHKTDFYKYFSIVPVNDSISGLSIKGAKYELSDTFLPKASTLCISNEIASESEYATIKICSGPAYIIQSSDF